MNTTDITVSTESDELQAISNWMAAAAREGARVVLDYSAGVWAVIDPSTGMPVMAKEVGVLLVAEDFAELADTCHRDLVA